MSDLAYRRTVKVRDIPADWRLRWNLDPDALVEVTLAPLNRREERSARRYFAGAAGLHACADDADQHLRRMRDEWDR